MFNTILIRIEDIPDIFQNLLIFSS